MSDMVAFVDPATIGALGCGTAGQRSQALANRFRNSKPNQLFLLPYHHVLVLLFMHIFSKIYFNSLRLNYSFFP